MVGGFFQFRLYYVYLLMLVMSTYGIGEPSDIVSRSRVRGLLCSCRVTGTVKRGVPNNRGCGGTLCIRTMFGGCNAARRIFSSSVM